MGPLRLGIQPIPIQLCVLHVLFLLVIVLKSPETVDWTSPPPPSRISVVKGNKYLVENVAYLSISGYPTSCTVP